MWGSLKSQILKGSMHLSTSASKGFTLLELLTVLFVIGLIAGLALPNLPLLFDRLEFALERDTVVRKLNELPMSAYEANQDLVLFGDYEGRDGDNDSFSQENRVGIEELNVVVPYRPSNLKRAALDLPDDWRLTIPEPIFYRSSGFCSGGLVYLEVGRIQQPLLAKAPFCAFTEETR